MGSPRRRTNQPRDAEGPFGLPLRFGNQILTDFDQHMRQTVLRAVAIEAVAFEGACVGRIVADNKPALGAQSIEQDGGQTVVAVPQYARVPGPRHTAPAWRETMNRQYGGHSAGSSSTHDRGSDGPMIWLVKGLKPMRKFRLVSECVHIAVRRNDCAVRQFHHQCRIIGTAIEIDQQTRIARKHSGTIKCIGQPPRDFSGPDVISDVTGKLGSRKTQRPIAFRQGV